MGHDLSSQVGPSLVPMTDGLDVVAVRIAHEGSEVVRVVLGPQARRVKYLSTAGERGIEKRPYRRAIGCGERDMRLTEPLPGDLVANPELGLGWWSVADCHSEVHDPLASQRGQHFVVEARAGTYVGALDREMVEHCSIIVYEHRRRHRWANSLFVTGLPDNGRGVIRWWVTRDCALVEDQQKRSCRTARPAVTNPRISV